LRGAGLRRQRLKRFALGMHEFTGEAPERMKALEKSEASLTGKICDRIDDHTIELFVMGKLEENAVRKHLSICPFCKPRIDEFTEYIEAMKQGLKQWIHEKG
jgi:hypothetical protein